MTRYLVVYEKTKTGYSAYVPDLPGVASTGDSKIKAEETIYDAIMLHLEAMKELKLRIPKPQAQSEVLVFN